MVSGKDKVGEKTIIDVVVMGETEVKRKGRLFSRRGGMDSDVYQPTVGACVLYFG